MIRGSTILPGGVWEIAHRYEVVWETMTPHPKVLEYTSRYHQEIVALGASDGVMLVGYGDWTDNLGPVSVIGYNLQTLQPVTLFADARTEAWGRINIIDGKAYLPHTDPTLDNQGAYTTNDRGVWETVKVGPNPSMIHSFDVIKFKGKVLCCGSAAGSGPALGIGCVYTETASDSRIFTRTLAGVSQAGFARFYKFFLYDNGNEVRVQNVAGGLETYKSTDGVNWVALPGEPAYTGNDAWDREVLTSLPANGYADTVGMAEVLSAYVHDGWIWVGGASGVVKRARLPV